MTISDGVRHVDTDLDHRRCDQVHVDLAGDEFGHHHGLRVGLHAAVKETDFEFRQRSGELRVQRDGRLQLEPFGFLDQRAYPVHLPSHYARRANALDDFRAPAVVHQMGRDRRSSRRHLV
jgi:hypothetical protein